MSSSRSSTCPAARCPHVSRLQVGAGAAREWVPQALVDPPPIRV
jgi:hypothetical protein